MPSMKSSSWEHIFLTLKAWPNGNMLLLINESGWYGWSVDMPVCLLV